MENVSGGFRPGPLRNATAATAIQATGYRIAEGGQRDVDTGNYDHSEIARTASPGSLKRLGNGLHSNGPVCYNDPE